MSHTEMDAANKSQIVHPTQWMMAGHRMPTVHPTRWRWNGDLSSGCCAVYFEEYGSWFRAIPRSWGHRKGLELQCTPAYASDDEPDTEQWGPVEEHGFECMGMPAGHSHDPFAVQWIEAINSAMANVWTMKPMNGGFKLEEFE